jgi:hypothetical protein
MPFTATYRFTTKSALMPKVLYDGVIERWWLKWKQIPLERGMVCSEWLTTSRR